MMIPEFIRFYGYTVKEAMDENAITFFSLVNSMYRLIARESLQMATSVSVGMNSDAEVIEGLKKQERGLHGIIQEVRIIKGE